MKFSKKYNPYTIIKSWLDTSFSRKIMFILLFCSTMIIFLSSFIYYFSMVHILKMQYIDSTKQLLEEVSQSIDRYYTQLNQVTLSFYNNNSFIDNLRFHRDDYLSQAENERVIKNVLYSDDSILYIYFYNPYTNILYSFSHENMSYTKFPEIEKETWYQNTLNSPNYFTISPLHTFINYAHFGTLNEDTTVFSINRAFHYYANKNYIGMISIIYNTSAIEQICHNLNSNHAYIAILDENFSARLNSYPNQTIPETIINTIAKNTAESGHTIYCKDHKKRILLWNRLNDIYLLKDLPLSELTQNITQSIIKIILILIIIFIILITGIAFYFSNTVTKKLNILTAKVIAFGNGEFSINSENYGKDEVGILASAFNEMTLKINNLINLEYKAKLLKKTAELQMLQAQVKPHFINNTLQAIGTLGLKKDVMEVYLMANALARTLRYTLKPTTQLIPLSKELENMKDYLYIQKILLGEQLRTIINVDEEVYDWLVPVFILQPLVENSIKHGLDYNTEGCIEISINQELNETLIIIISDNGRGIPSATLKMLQEWLQLSNSTNHAEEHIGILNIVNRMKLIYNEKASLTINSVLNEGTTIKIILPRKEIEHV